MVIIPSALKKFTYQIGDSLEVITIESRSGAWASIEESMQNLNLKRVSSLESFFSVAQMAISGFGHGLVPIGVARTLAVPEKKLLKLSDSGLTRPVRFVARKSIFSQELVKSFYAEVTLIASSLA